MFNTSRMILTVMGNNIQGITMYDALTTLLLKLMTKTSTVHPSLVCSKRIDSMSIGDVCSFKHFCKWGKRKATTADCDIAAGAAYMANKYGLDTHDRALPENEKWCVVRQCAEFNQFVLTRSCDDDEYGGVDQENC